MTLKEGKQIKALQGEYGFPKGDLVKYCKTLIRTGKDYREWALDYAAKGDHVRAFRENRDADENHRRVMKYFNMYEGLMEKVIL